MCSLPRRKTTDLPRDFFLRHLALDEVLVREKVRSVPLEFSSKSRSAPSKPATESVGPVDLGESIEWPSVRSSDRRLSLQA